MALCGHSKVWHRFSCHCASCRFCFSSRLGCFPMSSPPLGDLCQRRTQKTMDLCLCPVERWGNVVRRYLCSRWFHWHKLIEKWWLWSGQQDDESKHRICFAKFYRSKTRRRCRDSNKEREKNMDSARATDNGGDANGLEDLSQLTVKQLKDRLRELNLPVSGLKRGLIQRIRERYWAKSRRKSCHQFGWQYFRI